MKDTGLEGPDSAIVVADPTSIGVIEAFVGGKAADNASECEDVLVLSEHYVAVIDGMSSPLRRNNERPSGKRFAHAVGTAIATLPPDCDAVAATDAISAATSGVSSGHSGPSGAVAAILSLTRREVWRIGDVHVRIDDSYLPGSKHVDEIGTQYRAVVNHSALLAGASLHEIRANDPGLAALAPLLKGMEHLANRACEFGFGVLNGTTVPRDFIEVYSAPETPCDIVLATDGFLSAAPTLDEAESALRHALSGDPACIGLELRSMGKAITPGAHFPDDRCYVRIHLDAVDT